MAEPTIKIKRSSVAGKTPTTSNLALGELGLNTYDGKLFLKQDQGGVGVGTTVITVNPWSVGVGSVAYNTYFTAGNVGIGSEIPTSKLDVLGDVKVSGVITATTFIGNLTGTATTATTVAADSVGLGTHTYGDYVRNITGTSNQITVTSGTGEGSTPTLSVPNQFTAPQDVTVTRDLQVNRNLNVNGNITIGGSTATLFTTEFKVYDPDIVLGFRTDANSNDVSNDNTANHGGIAIASTEGSPLVQLFIAGIETNPATYKKIMWFKAGTFSGLGTDAWLSNYAVGIGSTQFPVGTRLAAGSVQFTENDLTVVRNINASGVVTAPTLSGTTATYTTGNFTTGNIVTGVVTTLSGTTATYTTGNFTTGNIVTGVVTTISGTNLNYTGVGTITTFKSTNATLTNINSSGISTLGVTSTTNLTTQNLNVSGLSTFSGISTFQSTLFGTQSSFTGIVTAGTFSGQLNVGVSTLGVTTVTNLTAQNLNVSGVTTTTTLELQSQIVSGYATSTTTATTANQVIYSGLSTVTYRSAEFLIQATQGTNYQIEKLITVHDGTTTYDSEYANVTSGNLVANYSTDISGGNIRLLVTPASANSTTYRIQYTAIKV